MISILHQAAVLFYLVPSITSSPYLEQDHLHTEYKDVLISLHTCWSLLYPEFPSKIELQLQGLVLLYLESCRPKCLVLALSANFWNEATSFS